MSSFLLNSEVIETKKMSNLSNDSNKKIRVKQMTELVKLSKRSSLNEKQNILKYFQPRPAAIDSALFE